jgi:hypothetical protein
MQHLLTNSDGCDLVQHSGGTYPEFVEHMMKCGTFGLEFTSSDTINRYVTSYNTKGNVSLMAWIETLHALTHNASSAGTSVRSITYKFMDEICKSRSG